MMFEQTTRLKRSSISMVWAAIVANDVFYEFGEPMIVVCIDSRKILLEKPKDQIFSESVVKCLNTRFCGKFEALCSNSCIEIVKIKQ